MAKNFSTWSCSNAGPPPTGQSEVEGRTAVYHSQSSSDFFSCFIVVQLPPKFERFHPLPPYPLPYYSPILYIHPPGKHSGIPGNLEKFFFLGDQKKIIFALQYHFRHSDTELIHHAWYTVPTFFSTCFLFSLPFLFLISLLTCH